MTERREPGDGASGGGPTRREFVIHVAALGTTFVAVPRFLGNQDSAPATGGDVEMTLVINGQARKLAVDPRTTLLDALRERLDLSGTKKGCDHGQCGACTVLVDGKRVLSCLTLALAAEGSRVTTIEGIANGEELHPVQAAFVKHDGFQCGYCTPGQICSAVAMIAEYRNGAASYLTPLGAAPATRAALTPEEVRERMSGNLCRCGAYPNIVEAIREAAAR